MQPDLAVDPATRADKLSLQARMPEAWRSSLLTLAIGAFAVMVLAAREWGEMVHQWWYIDTYSHILLVPFIIAWLVWLKLGELAKIEPRPWLPGLGLVAGGMALWLVGRATDINVVAHAGAVGALQGVVVTAIGVRASLVLALPIVFGAFLVPFGDEIIPPLQDVTARIAVALTEWSGIPAVVDGIFIDTPIGLFIVAEACSGVKFLVAMVTLAVLVSFTRFDSWSRRAVFFAVSIIVPIIANGVRAWGTIYVAQSQGIEFAAGFDHIFYGWVFFAIIVAVILAAAWRWFERESHDYGWTAIETDKLAATKTLERFSTSSVVAIAGITALAVFSAILAGVVAPSAMG